jgi:hypothetical protein
VETRCWKREEKGSIRTNGGALEMEEELVNLTLGKSGYPLLDDGIPLPMQLD